MTATPDMIAVEELAMPVLQLEPFVHPEELLAGADERPGGQWWVLHTRPRAEKTVARRLLQREASFYLPLHERPLASRGGRAVSHLPLFPGYVFLHGGVEARMAALETGLLVGCIPVVDQARLWSDLESVYRLAATDGNLRPELRMLPGQNVEIVAGPLEGMRGRWIRQGGRGRFFVEVQMLSQGVSVEIDDWMIQAL